MLENKQTSTAFEIARYYDKQKHYRAAAIYYNDVIRQQPGSREGDRAKKEFPNCAPSSATLRFNLPR